MGIDIAILSEADLGNRKVAIPIYYVDYPARTNDTALGIGLRLLTYDDSTSGRRETN